MTHGLLVDRSEPGVAIVSLAGEHETYTVPKLERELGGLLEARLALVIDLTQATFVDSSVVSVLLRAREDAVERGIPFFLVMDEGTGHSVQTLFEVTGLRRVFPVAASRAEAVGAVRGEAA
jgi:anti-sigma B factor antagonist